MFCSQRDDCGYDYEFTGEVPDTLLCIVCHLVLRDPVQIMSCGHRFCMPCFERMKSYSLRMKSDLCCPVDREIIDLSKVFKDTGISRDIGSLKVKCEKNGHGCNWIGELRYLQDHQDICKVTQGTSKKTDIEAETTSKLLAQVFARLSKCEEELLRKEKEIASLKTSIQEQKYNASHASKTAKTISPKTKINTMNTFEFDIRQEMQSLKQMNINYVSDLNAIKSSHMEMEKEMKAMKKKNHLYKEEIINLTSENNKQRKDITDTRNKLDGLIEQNLVTRGITKISNERKVKPKEEYNNKYSDGVLDEWGRRIRQFRR